MKKFIIIISLLVIIICIGTFVSANNNIDWKSKIKFLENFSLTQTVNSNNVAKTQTIKMNGEKLKLEYKETRNELNVYVAKNNEKDEYTFKDGKLVGFLKQSEETKARNSEVEIDEQSAKEIAEEFGKSNVEDFNKYEFANSKYIKSYDQYNIRYIRKINGIDTRDVVEINVAENGEIASFSAVNQGEFEKYSNTEIDVESIKQSCLEIVKNKYGDKIKRIEIEQQYLKIEGGKLVVQTDLGVFLEDKALTEIYQAESLIYEVE